MHVLEDYPIIHSKAIENFHLNFSLQTAFNITLLSVEERENIMFNWKFLSYLVNNVILTLPLEVHLWKDKILNILPYDFELSQLATVDNFKLRGTMQHSNLYIQHRSTERSKKQIKISTDFSIQFSIYRLN